MAVIENPTDITPIKFWDLYAEKIITTAIYPGQGSHTGLTYVALGLAGECGEFSDQCKKVIRDDGNVLTPERALKLSSELGDVLWYTGGAAREIKASFSEILMCNPPEWVRAPLVGMGTPTGLSKAAFRLNRAVALFVQQVDHIGTNGGIPAHADIAYMRTHLAAIYYAANLCAQQIGMDLRQVGANNVDKLFDRRDRGVLQGSGNNR